MNEQLAEIRTRRAAITPGVWSASWAWGKSGGVYNAWAEAPFTSGTCLEDVAPQAEADATFIAAAPGDVDTLLAMVDALAYEYYLEHGREWNGLANIKVDMGVGESYTVIDDRELAALTAERDERSLVAEQLSMVLHIRDTQLAALTAERDALAQQLQQAQAQLAGDVVEPILWKAAPPKRHEWDEDAATTPSA